MFLLTGANLVLPLITVGLLCLIIGGVVIRIIPFFGYKDALKKNQKIIKEAENKSEQISRNAQVEGKTLVYEMKVEAEKEIKEKKKEVQDLENKLTQREQNIDRRDIALQTKEDNLDFKNEQLNKRLTDVDKKEAELNEKIDSIIHELERVASLSTTEAKNELFKRVEEKMSQEVASYIKNKEEEAKETANRLIDIENKLMVTRGERGGGINYECGIKRYTLLYIKQITNKDLLYNTGNYIQYLIITYNGKELQGFLHVFHNSQILRAK